ncbi:MAG: RNA methyltransferase [Bdellovibrionales bacterium]|nr:RNA methyltransferase [Bdellovibrionales bacterium]
MKSEQYQNLLQQIEILQPFINAERMNRIHQVISQRTLNIVPVLEHIYDRGNISAVMRSAEAFGFVNFHIIDRPDGQFKVSNRVTQGTDKWLRVKKHQTTTACLKQLKTQGFKIYATHLDATTAIEDIDFTKPSAIILGNEKEGVSSEALEYCDERFIVPMYGFAQSFNISVAAALCFYHIHRYRSLKLPTSGDLPEYEKAHFTLEYMCKSLKSAKQILNKYQICEPMGLKK